MPMYAREFFAEPDLPFAEATVVGNTYYATPTAEGPPRLRIDFSPTIRADEYDGLRLATIHQDRGELDVAHLRFADHKTFDHRDSAYGRTSSTSGYAVFKEHRDAPDRVPWKAPTPAGFGRIDGADATLWILGGAGVLVVVGIGAVVIARLRAAPEPGQEGNDETG